MDCPQRKDEVMTLREMFADRVGGPILTVLLALLAVCCVMLVASLATGVSAEAIQAEVNRFRQEQAKFASLSGKTITTIARDPRDIDTVLATFSDGSSLRLHAHGYKGANLDATFSGVK